MGSVIANLLPLILGSAIVPVWIIMVILILGGTGGRAKAIAFVAGLTLVRLIQVTVFGLVFNNTDTSSGENDSRTITSVLLLVVAVLMLVTAARQFLVGAELLLILPILYAVVSPKSSTATLGAVSGWLEAHNRPIVIAVSLIFGLFFLWKSLNALL